MTSLEELLAEEGFRGRRSSGMRSRASFRADTAGVYPFSNKNRTDSPSSSSGQRIKSERSRMDLLKYKERSNSSRTARESLFRRERFDGRTKTMSWDKVGRGVSDGVREDKKIFVRPSRDADDGEEEDEKVKDIYFDKGYNEERSETSLKASGDIEIYEEHSRKDAVMDERRNGNLNKHLMKHVGSGTSSRKGLKHQDLSRGSSFPESKNSKSFENEDDHPRARQENTQLISAQVALDEVAVQAMVSILTGYIKRFFKDEEFRITLRTNCFSSFGITEIEQERVVESKVIANLEEAIVTAEQAALELVSAKDLKKACLQLSVITGLNSNENKDGYTCGVPNSRLSACARIYLSVLYKLQKKDWVSAKHLLQVFCDSPFLARSLLLPELWEYLFLPHLSHLRMWYNQEAESLQNTPSRIRKHKLLVKVYNEILDSGTYQFAAYYKDWLTDGVEAPILPSICIPTVSVQEVHQGGSQDHSFRVDSPYGPLSPQPMVSKKMYESVFGCLPKPGDHEVGISGEVDNFDNYASCSDGSTSEVKKTLTCSSHIIKHLDGDTKDSSPKHTQQDQALAPDQLVSSVSKEEWKLVQLNVAPEFDVRDTTIDSNAWQDAAGVTEIQITSLHRRDNELAVRSLAKSILEPQEKENYDDLIVPAVLRSEIESGRAACEDIHTNYDRGDKDSSIAGILTYFVCPLTGRLFDDPVTLETGETFEREAIIEWLNKGNRTCPVTGKTLESRAVPCTNSVLKRVIDGWKSEHCHHPLPIQMVTDSTGYGSMQTDEATVDILEQILTTLGKEERLANAQHLISLGGLEFLIRRFKLGHLEEKAQVVTLLCSCMEANSSCRNQIVENIDNQCLIELLHSKDPKCRGKAVHLLIELICLSRKKVSTMFLKGFGNEEIVNMMHILLVYLQSSPLEQKPSVAVLLLHLDLLAEPKKYSIYREEAVDAIVTALEGSLMDDQVRGQCCKSLLILGGRFSASGKLLTKSWILNQAGFNNMSEANHIEENVQPDDDVPLESDEENYEEWLRNLAASLLGNEKRSFLEITSKCIGSKNLDLVGACLTTVAWLSDVLPLLSEADFQLPAFSALISGLKESLEHGVKTEHKVLASVSLLNFSEISECRVLLMTIADEIAAPLRDIAQVTWTAKQLYSIIIGEDL